MALKLARLPANFTPDQLARWWNTAMGQIEAQFGAVDAALQAQQAAATAQAAAVAAEASAQAQART